MKGQTNRRGSGKSDAALTQPAQMITLDTSLRSDPQDRTRHIGTDAYRQHLPETGMPTALAWPTWRQLAAGKLSVHALSKTRSIA
jgi:hypothetical protein